MKTMQPLKGKGMFGRGMRLALLIPLTFIPLTIPLTFTGCSSTPQSREAIVYLTFKDIQTVAHNAYGVFADRVVLGAVTVAEKEKVEAAYKQYQDAFRLAFTAAAADWSKPVPANVKALADALTKLIYQL